VAGTKEVKMNRKSIILIILWIAVIFSFSLQSGHSSNTKSLEVKNALAPIAHELGIKAQPVGTFLMRIYHEKNITPGAFLFRKIAHMTEYMILGIIVMLTIIPHRQKSKRLWIITIMIGPLVALIDELIIQAFISRGRTSSLYDVVIDSAGYFIGVTLILFISLIRKKLIHPIPNKWANIN
jgi:VanZ family protein